MKKRMIGLAVVVAGLLIVGACSPERGGRAGDEIVIGVSIPAATHGWTAGVNYHAERAKSELAERYPNVRFQIVTAGNAVAQANDLEDLVQIHRIDALVILPFESAPLTEPVRNVHGQGILTTVVDRGLEDQSIQDIYVAGNNPQLGQVSAEYIIEALDGAGDIVILRGIPTVIDNQRFDAFMETIAGTDINVLGSEYANWNRDDGFTVMQDFLTRFPKIDAVWAQDDDIAMGVIAAVKQAGREEELFIVGGAGMKEVIKRVMDGDRLTPVNVLYSPAMIADAMEITVKHLTGEEPAEKEYILPAPLITTENAAEYYFPDSPF